MPGDETGGGRAPADHGTKTRDNENTNGPGDKRKNDDERRYRGHHAERGSRRLSAHAAAQARRGHVARIAFAFSDIRPANRFFKPMVRELKFDVSEMAIASFVQAKAYGKPLVLLPATMMGRFQHGTMLRRVAHPLTPADLPGKRVGVRSYSQTTAVWVRGILQNDYGVDVDRVHWVTFEDGHVAEYHEPPGVERAGADKNLLKMLRDGELDAAIYGADLPNDPTLTSLIPDPEAAAPKWYAQHRVVPINHMVVVQQKLADGDPAAIKQIYRLLVQA
jgi:4,5-dihydroxyphthalate decarboxylase